MQDLSTKIALRFDTAANWESANPILLSGEIAVVIDGQNQLFKVGDGKRNFNDLPYSFYEQFASKLVQTDMLKAKSISQGYGNDPTGIGDIATGYKSKATSNFAQAHGYQAKVSSDFGYVWNGDNSLSTYADHGRGTFNVNPKNGLSGFYIGDENLKEIVSAEINDAISRNETTYYVRYEIDNLGFFGEMLPTTNVDGYPYDDYRDFLAITKNQTFDGSLRLSCQFDFNALALPVKGLLIPYSLNLDFNALEHENLSFSDLIAYGSDGYSWTYEHPVLGNLNLRIVAKKYYDAYSYSKPAIDEKFSKIPQPDLSEYYKKIETSSLQELNTEFKRQSTVAIISNDITYSKDLSVIKLSAEEYYQLVADDKVNASALYVVEDQYNNAFGKQIKNVAVPELSDDAATKAYVDIQISSIPKPDMSEYYKKNETSSASEIQQAFDNIPQPDLSDYYMKNETSSATEIEEAFENRTAKTSIIVWSE